MASEPSIRWRLADEHDGQPALFEDRTPIPGTRELAGLEFTHVRAMRIINTVPEAARLPFRFTLNAYRGCSHACVYCFARPTHEYLGMDRGRDFERRIVVKVNAVERLRAELAAPRWGGDLIAMGTNTDPYQPCEGRYQLTRGIITAMTEARNPFSILTKATLIERDADLIAAAAERCDVRVDISIGCLDADVWRLTEPATPSPTRRLETVARLTAAGVRCGVFLAPVLPGISDAPAQLRSVIRGAIEAGAVDITPISLHLRPGVREHYFAWLQDARPELVAEYERRYRGAYLPRTDQRDLTQRVRRMVVEERARHRDGVRGSAATVAVAGGRARPRQAARNSAGAVDQLRMAV